MNNTAAAADPFDFHAATGEEHVANVFTTSSPESRPDWCDSVGRWRCEHIDALRAVLASFDTPFHPADGYYADNHRQTPSGALQLWVGARNNNDASEQRRRLEAMRAYLLGLGFKVKRSTDGGRLVGLVITDRKCRATA